MALWLRAGLIGLLAGWLSGCAGSHDEAAAKFCRSLLPALNGGEARIVVLSAQTRALRESVLVTLRYEARGPAGQTTLERGFDCLVRPVSGRWGAFDLEAAATEDGPLGPMRLHLLKRRWIGKGHAALADPQPVRLVGPMPEVGPQTALAAQALLAGLPALSIYALLAAAYALIYGLVQRINLAFGEMALLAGYGTFLGIAAGGAGGTWAVIAIGAFAGVWTAAALGYALGRWVFASLLERPGQHMLIATLGVGIVWSELARLTQGAGQRWLSPLFATPVAIARTGEDFVTVTPMVVVATCLAASALGSVLMALARSTFGRRWRAVAEEPTAAALCGVSAERVLAQTMMVAAALAGLAGALTALHFGGVGSGGGLVIGLKALIAAVIGGIGSVAGAVAGAVVVGLAETAWSLAFPIEYRDLAMFAALAAVLVFRPEGPWRQDRW